MMRYLVERKVPKIIARGQGQRNCGTFHGYQWEQIYLVNDLTILNPNILTDENYRIVDREPGGATP